jgi:hypothetical protein
MVEQFKADQLHAAKKSFARASVKPNSAVAALIEKRNQTLFLQSLVPSPGTLIVVPSVLMEHWQVRYLCLVHRFLHFWGTFLMLFDPAYINRTNFDFTST